MVVCFLSLLSRGGREYDNFIQDPQNFGEPLLPPPSAVEHFTSVRLAGPPPPVLPPPNEAEYGYLYNQLSGFDSSEAMIYESKDWVSLIAKAGGQLAWYYDLVVEAIKTENINKTFLSKHNVQILYRYFPEADYLFLIAPLTDKDTNKRTELENKYKGLLESMHSSLSMFDRDRAVENVEFLKRSARAYPAFITADNDIWLRIQKNTEANLALSPEESAILDSVSHYTSTPDKIFPLFINGRPGSGKSTILQYLFAEHLYCHLSKPQEERLAYPPLYLTYSQKLLQWANTVVKSLLLCSSKLIVQGEHLRDLQIENELKACFAVFHRLLHRFLPDEEKLRFDYSRRLDFPEFRRRWHEKIKSSPKAELRNLSAELVWHVIRTYIKGMRDDENNYLDLDAYSELPFKQRTVEKETYAKIYDGVWDAWYKPLCENEGYWDDQDLARAVLDVNSAHLSNHPAVFCDEAQDFTKIELELILRLSLYSRRALQGEDLKRVPFAFAGDPFQTLNPTGFDWGSVQAGFHEKIVQELDRSSRYNLDFNYQELHYNYRSSRYIVGFCNLIQLLRGILFEVKFLKPQRSWFDEDAPPPVFFYADHPSSQTKLEEQSEVVIILPCQEGEEDSYIKTDPLLSRLAMNEIRNFLSPMSAKGLEFSRVVLYKFGEDCLKNYSSLFEPLATGEPHSRNPEQGLPLQYFVNRLYVAASRPKRRLFIVDTKEGIERFWNSSVLRNPGELLKLYRAAESGGWSVDDLTWIQPGREGDWTEDRDNPDELAKQFLGEGLANKDPYKLRLAEANFRRVGKSAEEQGARAARLEIEGEFEQAAKEYLGLGDNESALRLFWKAKAYGRILEQSVFASTNEHQAATFTLSPKSPASCKSFLDFLYNEITSANRAKFLADKHWGDIANSLVAALAGLPADASNWASAYSQIEMMMAQGFDLTQTGELAELAFRAGRHKDAIMIWESDPTVSQKSDSYKLAKAETEDYPNNLTWFQQLRKYDRIVQSYEENPNLPVPLAEADWILSAFQKSKRQDQALQFAVSYLNARLEAGHWKRAIELIENKGWEEEQKDRLRASLINVLSNSDVLTADTEQQNIIAEYLKQKTEILSTNSLIAPRALGAAIERAGKIIDALVYYESIWRSGQSVGSADVVFARERWLRCKYKQVDHSEGQGKVGDATRQKRDADRMASQWRITVNDLPLYPLLDYSTEEDSGTSPKLSADQLKAIQDLLDKKWKAPQIASVLSVSIQDVERVRLSK